MILVPSGAYFAALSRRLNSSLFEQHGVELEHRQVGRKLELDVVVGKDLAGAAQRAADDFAEIASRT